MIVGTLLAAAKGVVGATAVTMGLIVLPAMVRHGYDPRLAAGTVAATSTLAQIFPPATVLVLLGDQINNAYQSAQLAKGVFAPELGLDRRPVRRRDRAGLRAGRTLHRLPDRRWRCSGRNPRPRCRREPGAPHGCALARRLIEVLVAPVLLILIVLGSILGGLATPTESASLGAVGAILLALLKMRARGFRRSVLMPVMAKTTHIATMIFTILIGATFSAWCSAGSAATTWCIARSTTCRAARRARSSR